MADPGTLALTLVPAIAFALFALIELARPRRTLRFGRWPRWLTAVALFAGNRAALWLIAWLVAVPAAANWAEAHDFGLFNRMALPLWVEILAAFILLDFALWLQHLLTHKVPLLWRMHKVHHADPDIDVSTALRFHPFEIAVSVLWKAAWVALLGIPALVALAFEAWLAANAAFNHGNIELPRWLDRLIRQILVTPDMHLVHHSALPHEQQRNYGFALTLWDRLFGTYADESSKGRAGQAIGLAELQDSRPTEPRFSFKLPLT